jgi:hypothetical protein
MTEPKGAKAAEDIGMGWMAMLVVDAEVDVDGVRAEKAEVIAEVRVLPVTTLPSACGVASAEVRSDGEL